jgi:hypothetical protein
MNRPFAFVFVAIVALAGCRGEDQPRYQEPTEHQAPADSRFEATVSGDFSYTLQGRASYRTSQQGHLLAIELDEAGDGQSGISFSMDPTPIGAQTFVIMDQGATEGMPRFQAFYNDEDREYTGLDGTLAIEPAMGNRLAGTFEVVMRGFIDDGAEDTVEFTISGSFQAVEGHGEIR